MSTFRMDVRLDRGEAAERAITALRRSVQSGDALRRAGRGLTARAQRILRDLTPRQLDRGRAARSAGMEHPTSRGFDAIYKGWTSMVERETQTQYETRVFNLATGTIEGLIVLASLEFGARPHEILPTSGNVLAWEEAEGGLRFESRGIQDGTKITDVRREVRGANGLVVARGVRHPGMRGRHFVEEAESIVGESIDEFMDQAAQEYSKVFTDAFGVDVARG